MSKNIPLYFLFIETKTKHHILNPNIKLEAKKIVTIVFYIVGLGMSDEEDIIHCRIKAVKSYNLIFLKKITLILGVDTIIFKELYGTPISIADNHMIEYESKTIYLSTKERNMALLKVNDEVCTTTYTNMISKLVN